MLHREGDSLRGLYENLGIVDSINAPKKLTYKHDSVNKKIPYELDHNMTTHSMALQRSKYVTIESNTTASILKQGNIIQKLKP